MNVINPARLTCPKCGIEQAAEMPTDACQFFYICVHCNSTLRPIEGDCCVFCSYADIQCPSKQPIMAYNDPNPYVPLSC